ncbi:MAG: hypothetical protein WCJ62_01935 [Flavobacterium sp.]
MKKIIHILFVAIYLTQSSFAQNKTKIPTGFLQAMQGDWKGKLTYTDYQDDKSQTTMDVWLKSELINNKLVKQFFYKEPDGNTKQKAKSQDTTFIINNGSKLIETGYKHPFIIKDFTAKESEESSKKTTGGITTKSSLNAMQEQIVIMETEDYDNEKLSTIRISIAITKNSLTIKKEVKYNGTENFFTRHTFYYTK